jgi:hypothetical protein
MAQPGRLAHVSLAILTACSPSLGHILCQAETYPEHAPDVVHTEGVSGPREAGEPAWGRTAQRRGDDHW